MVTHPKAEPTLSIRISDARTLVKKTCLLAVCLLPAMALAQSDVLENPGTVSAVQDRTFRMSHELTLSVGVLPLDAFYKGVTAQVGYTYHFTDSFAWTIGRGLYSYNLNTGLKNQLEKQFGVLPTAFPEVQYMLGSDLVWSPIYGKGAWLNATVTHFEAFGVLGLSVLNLVNGVSGASFNFSPAVNVGLGARIFSGKHVSYRLDFTDNIVISKDRIFNVPTIQLSAAFNFGSNE